MIDGHVRIKRSTQNISDAATLRSVISGGVVADHSIGNVQCSGTHRRSEVSNSSMKMTGGITINNAVHDDHMGLLVIEAAGESGTRACSPGLRTCRQGVRCIGNIVVSRNVAQGNRRVDCPHDHRSAKSVGDRRLSHVVVHGGVGDHRCHRRDRNIVL